MKPKIVLTCGDINGIGPEIILKIFSIKNLREKYDLKVIGPYYVFEYYSKLLRIKNLSPPDLIDLNIQKTFKIKTGHIDSLSGRIAGNAIKKATELTIQNKFDAIVTMPINKKALNMGGHHYEGHTDMLAELTHSTYPVMIMYCKKIIIVPLTIHIPVNQISDALDRKTLIIQIQTIRKILNNRFGIKKPKLSLLSLNPHNGEKGLLGKEEEALLIPIVRYLKTNQFNIEGTFAADAYFGNKTYKNFDVTMAMYHDQGLIPFKMLAGKKGVNFTGGINIIRTSPSHGTAYDIAGKGFADINSSLEAIKLANNLAVKLKK